MIAMPFHPSNVYTIEELKANLDDILNDVEKKAAISLDGKVPFTLKNKVHDGKLLVDQGIIAGCAGGGFENICDAADILKGHSIGDDAFTLSVYPASTPIYMELAKNGVLADLLETGAVVKTAFCGPCFGAGDTPENAYGLRGDYTILTMYQAEAIEAQEALSNIKIHELVTSKQGNVVISVSETGVTIDTEY